MNSNNFDAGIIADGNNEDSAWIPPGSNLACSTSESATTSSTTRIRREWDHLDDYDRALYLDAVETAIERGIHQRFAIFHFDEVSEIQAHDTCGFYLWHRVFVLAYENMLRSLEPRFACLTVPFWDIYRDFSKQESATNNCRSYATCSKIINDLGGVVENDDFKERMFFGRKVDGLWHFKAPLQNLRDDNNQVGMIRYDLWFDPIPEEASVLSVDNIEHLFGNDDRVAFWEILHHGIHDSVHDTIGGFMRTPASPIDPLFMPWHSTMELFDYVWEACHSANATTTNDTSTSNSIVGSTVCIDEDRGTCLYTPEARNRFPNISLSTDEVYMKLGNTTDIRDDPIIGTYFPKATRFADFWQIKDLDKHYRFRYVNIPQNFFTALANNTKACPNGLASVLSQMEKEQQSYNESNAGLIASRQPPSFSNQQLEVFKQNWIEEAQSYYNGIAINETTITTAATPNFDHHDRQNPFESDSIARMEFVRCLLFEAMDRDTIERWAIDRDAFLTQVIINERYNTHPLCRDRLFVGAGLNGTEGDESFLGSSEASSDTKDELFASSAICQGGWNSSGWLLVVLLIFIVSKTSR